MDIMDKKIIRCYTLIDLNNKQLLRTDKLNTKNNLNKEWNDKYHTCLRTK